MRALVIGSGGTIGSTLVAALQFSGVETRGTTRRELNLECVPRALRDMFGPADVVYICAAMTRFIECEDDPRAYRVNVDAPAEIARQYAGSKIVYTSSEAVERALHTNYGMHKALAEMALRTVCEPVIARISKVEPWALHSLCDFMVGLSRAEPGVYRWKSGPILKVASGGVN